MTMIYQSNKVALCFGLLGSLLLGCSALISNQNSGSRRTLRAITTTAFLASHSNIEDSFDSESKNEKSNQQRIVSQKKGLSCQQHQSPPPQQQRRDMIATSLKALGAIVGTASSSIGWFGQSAWASEAGTDDFASIAALASKISKDLESGGNNDDDDDDVPVPTKTTKSTSTSSISTAYDFDLPMTGSAVPFRQLVTVDSAEAAPDTAQPSLPKAIVVVNIKQDDPLARKNIPELMSLASKYGRTGDFVVVACPTDQGYFEADTSTLIRLKLASEYGYGINPATIITDKVNLLGKSAHPFWRWLEGTCRTPAGLGRVEGNFEKFLVDGRTGLPLRRYPRKYMPLDMQDDIEAVLEQRPLPPASANWKEEWRVAAAEAERDTYRFQKGLNVF